MAFNTSGAVPAPLSVFGSWVTEMDPVSLPEGVSPDNQDVSYLPGSVFSRPGAVRYFSTPFPAGGPNNAVPTLVYGKSFVTPVGTIYNLYFDSNGVMWYENVNLTPRTYTQLFQSTPGSFCKSITAFGSEWFAISDGLHGSDIAYVWDGTNLDRVTQDGPGQPPSITSIALPSVAMVAAGTTSTPVTSVIPNNATVIGHPPYSYTIYLGLLATVTSTAGISTGQSVTIAGNTLWNGTFGVEAVLGPTQVQLWYSTTTSTTGTGGTMTIGTATTLVRNNNAVTVSTASAHNLQVGYQVQISKMPTTLAATATAITIKNEDIPGQALVTTSAAHGLSPGLDVTILGVNPANVGTITTASCSSGIVTLTTSAAHGLVPGAQVQISGVTTTTGSTAFSFNGTFTVAQTPSPVELVYAQALGSADPDVIAGTGGTVSITWPVPDDTPTPTYFTVLSAPSATTFYIQVTYTNGTWSTGSIYFGWDGIFYVTQILSSTSFVYQQYGPNATTSNVGTVTPYGQCAPGIHLCQILWQTRQGLVTAPSPPIRFEANGGQYLSITSIPLAPTNVVEVILAFTGAQPNVQGELPPFFYIPVPAQVEGLTVSTSTTVTNGITSALLDFSDNTLFAAIGISITGNQPVNQIVLDGALGFAYSDSRLITWGQRNAVQNLLGMHFGGGNLSGIDQPLGWTVPSTSVGGTYSPSNWGGAWAVSASALDTLGTSGNLYQGAFEDAYGVPICEPKTLYKIRAQIGGVIGTLANLTLVFYLSSASASFTYTASIAGSSLTTWQADHFGYFEATFSNRLPAQIPNDLVFGFYAVSSSGIITFQTSEWSLIDSENPYLDTDAYLSYVNNPMAFDGETGNLQPTEDSRKVMDFSVLRGTLYLHTQDPSGKIHEVLPNPTSEPIGWEVKEIAANCGVLSAFCVTHSQADDQSASGGEDWTAWASEGGAMVFDGSEPKKVSQEIQPNWNEPFSSNLLAQINMGFATAITTLNDPVERVIYFFLPVGTVETRFGPTFASAPTLIYPLSYRELNGAYAIANSPPFHPSLSGRLIATDNTRKWTRWNLAMNGAARMYVSLSGKLQTIFFGGNGLAPGISSGFGNTYTLDPTKLTDDDYGQINPYYVTCFFLDAEKAQALGLFSVRILLAYINCYITGTGNVTYSYLVNRLGNVWPLNTVRTLSSTANFDQEMAGGSAMGNRIAIKIASSPATGTDNGFNLQRIQPWWKKAKLALRGAAQ